MDDDQRQHLETLRETHLERLRVLERQAAEFGDLNVPTHISTQIESLCEKIADIERQLGALPGPSPGTQPLPAIWNIPHPRNPNFTGRAEQLIALQATLTPGQAAALTQPQAIHGLGGVGKTQLAVEYAYRHASGYRLVWWIHAQDITTLSADYAALAQKLNLPEQQATEQAVVVDAVRQWLEQNAGWLLIFDNATSPADLLSYLPGRHTGHILITSRNPNWGEIAEQVRVAVFPPDDAVSFLLKRTYQSDHTAAEHLADTLGRLPLALAQAGAYIAEKQLSLAAYRALFTKHRSKLLAQNKPLTYPDTVATTWELSMRDIRRQFRPAVDLLSLCAFLGPDDIPTTIITDGAKHLPHPLGQVVSDPLEFEEALGALRRYSLIERSDDTLSVHRMVQAVISDRLSEKNRQKWATAAVNVVNKAFPSGSNDVRTWPVSARLLPHALAVAGAAEPLQAAPEATGRLLNEVGVYLRGRGEFAQAKAHFERALTIYEAAHGPDHPSVVTVRSNLGNVLRDLGNLAGAKAQLERALATDEATHGPDHPFVATSRNNLGNVLRDLGDLEGAKAQLERALEISETAYGPNHPTVAIRLNNLGNVLRDLGNLAGAKAQLERALTIDKATYGPDHPELAADLNNLGGVLRALGDLEGAKAQLERALTIYEAAYGPDHPTVATSRNNLGTVLQDLGDFAGAKAQLERALTIDEAALGKDHPQTTRCRNNLRLIEQQLNARPPPELPGRYDEA